MKIDIKNAEVQKGLLRKKTYHRVSLKYSVSEANVLHTVNALAGIAPGAKLVPCVLPQASISKPNVSRYQFASLPGSA